ncbi:hypothetical protein ACU4GD_22810 [Cupriavidus basilensis]
MVGDDGPAVPPRGARTHLRALPIAPIAARCSATASFPRRPGPGDRPARIAMAHGGQVSLGGEAGGARFVILPALYASPGHDARAAAQPG